MAYLGNTPQNQAFTPAIDYFSGNGSTTAFTLSRPVASVAQMIVAVANVIQNPSSAYTVSGNTITLTNNVSGVFGPGKRIYFATGLDKTNSPDINSTKETICHFAGNTCAFDVKYKRMKSLYDYRINRLKIKGLND